MKTWKLSQFYLANSLRSLMLLLGITFFCQLQTAATAQAKGPLPFYNPFFVRNYGGKCLDFGPAPQVSGAPVFISDCNGTDAQRVVVVEVDPRPISKHEVLLFADNNKVIGVTINALFSGVPLELQDYNGSAGQIFELDGDSIILAADRNLVVEVQRSRGANGTSLVLGSRDLDDAEFWTFTSSDGSNRRPTLGFVQVNGSGLHAQIDFLKAVYGARWGTVIELDPNVSINLTDIGPLLIPAGVTIRGDRHGASLGPELRTSHASDLFMLDIAGNGVRITGLRLRGPSRSLELGGREDRGILAHSQYTSIIDHNDLSDWPVAAIEVTGDWLPDRRNPRPENVIIKRNFIHHNRGNARGYGVVIVDSGYASIWGNTFVENRHAIAGDGSATSGYRAWFNLVLKATSDYKPNNPFYGYQQDFDMHGTGNIHCDYCGGMAGNYIEIARNTFLGSNRENFYLRGTPTHLAEFHNNVLVGLRSFAIKNLGDPDKLIIRNNQFLAPHPAHHLGVGDFDDDGIQDLFMATGTAWYYAPAGRAEWHYLNSQTDTLTTLLFGDFDADGRTDIFTQHDYSWDVSWGGASRWEQINVSEKILGNAATGDFIGDERDDVFYTDGQMWYASDGGISHFTPLSNSGYRVSRLRFGDFNVDGKTDVFSVVDGYWKVSYSGASHWEPLRPKLTNSVAGLIVADFNGDGRADIATFSPIYPSGSFVPSSSLFKVSYSGTEDWTGLGTYNLHTLVAAIGSFESNANADILLWHNLYLDLVAGGTGLAVRHSREDMR